MSHFQAKKSILTSSTTPIKTPTTNLAVITPERVNPNPNTRIRNNNFALSVSEVRRKAIQLRKSDIVGSGPQNLSGSGSLLKTNGSGSQKQASILPLKYEMLCDFFFAMLNSLRLLRMKGVPATFAKLARHIESLTDRRFTLHYLAQMKYIIPEVIVAKKIRVLDEKTKCMQEDYLLSIDMDAVEIDKNTKGGDMCSQLKKIFRSRVTDFYKTHLEEDEYDIPEGELPHLFFQPKQEPESNPINTSTPSVASLIAPSFKRRFSSKAFLAQVSECSSLEQSTCFSEAPINKATSSESNDEFCSITDEAVLGPGLTPAKPTSMPQKIASTPSEFSSTPARLMSATPALRTPKRTIMSRDDDTCELTNKSAKRRSLNFNENSVDFEDQSSLVNEEDKYVPTQGSTIAKDDVLAVLPENLLQSLRDKEKKITEEKDPVVSQARRRQQMMAGVPKLFDMIRLLFQSTRRNVITKEELIHKLLSGHMDITDKIEVEEQLKLLQELAPEYISEQISLSGDTLVSLNKYSSADSIRHKLLEASSN